MPSIPEVIFLAICAGITAYAVRILVLGTQSRLWPSVTGIVTLSRVEQVLFGNRGGGDWKSVLRLEYSYDVAGRSYTGKRIAMDPSGWFSLGSAAELHRKYPQNKSVAVFYSPAKPELSTLAKGVPRHLWSFYAIAGMFALI